MGTLNTGSHASESAPQNVSAVPGLGKKIMTAALAAIGIATSAEQVEAATLLNFSAPTLVPGGSSNVVLSNTATLDLGRLATNSRGVQDQLYSGISRIEFTSPGAGTVTLSWDSLLSTGIAPGDNTSVGYPNTTFDANQRVFFGVQPNSMNQIAFMDGPATLNLGSSGVGSGGDSGFTLTQSFENIQLPVSAGQTYFIDMRHEGVNTNSFSQIDNLKISFEGIPEPSTTALLGGAAALLLRRKRDNKDSSQESSV